MAVFSLNHLTDPAAGLREMARRDEVWRVPPRCRLCPDDTHGRPFHPDRFSREFDRRVERHGLSRIRLHEVRHSWATSALEAGVDSTLVSDRLGHSTIAITVKHLPAEQASGAAEKVAGLMFGPG